MCRCWKCDKNFKESELMWMNIKHMLRLLCSTCIKEEQASGNIAPTTKTSS